MSTWMQTASGKRFDFAYMRHSDICIQDVAWSLSNLCRFNGHTRTRYTVAEHSCRVHDRVPESMRLAGLLHDAHEAYVGDLPTPLEAVFDGPELRQLEHEVQSCVLSRFGILDPLPLEVNEADRRMCATEARDLLPGGPVNGWHIDYATPYADFRFLTPWDSERSYNEFLKRYEVLTGEKC